MKITQIENLMCILGIAVSFFGCYIIEDTLPQLFFCSTLLVFSAGIIDNKTKKY